MNALKKLRPLSHGIWGTVKLASPRPFASNLPK